MLHVAYWTDLDTYGCILGSIVGTDQVMSTEKKDAWYHLKLEIDDDPEKS